MMQKEESASELSQMVLLQRKIYDLHRIYFRYIHQPTVIVFIILSTTKQAKSHLSNAIITQVSLFDYVIYSSADSHCWECGSAEE